MDKKILDALVKYGFVTNICVDPEKYKDVDDLINKGIVTVPGAKEKIMEIIKDLGVDPIDVNPVNENLNENLNDTTVTITDTPETVVPIDETSVDEPVITDAPADETPLEDTPVEEPTVTETVKVEEDAPVPVEETLAAESAPKKKKSTKKAE